MSSLFYADLSLVHSCPGLFQLDKQRAFESVFGIAAILDPVMLEKVKGDTPANGYLDTDNDGKPEVWFIDTDARLTSQQAYSGEGDR